MSDRRQNEKNGSWTPSAYYLEDEMQSLQPEYDLVFDRYRSAPGPATLLGPLLNEENDSGNNSNEIYNVPEELSSDDEEDYTVRERESLKMLRNFGIESSLGGHITSKNTLPTPHRNSKVIHQKNFPILLDEEYFQFNSTSTSSIESSLASSTTPSPINSAEKSRLDEILGINRDICDTKPEKTLEEKFNEDFPDLQTKKKLKNSETFCTPKQLYLNKKKV